MLPQIHDVKCDPNHFKSIKAGVKTSELLENIQQFRGGDYVLMREWDNAKKSQGDTLMLRVTDVLSSSTGLVSGHVVVSFKLLS